MACHRDTSRRFCRRWCAREFYAAFAGRAVATCLRANGNWSVPASGAVEGPAHDPTSELMVKVVLPALSAAETEFERAIGRISLDDMAQLAVSENASETAKKRA
jgi:hypothetical protein